MLGGFLKLVRSQRDRKDRHTGLQLRLHHARDNGGGDKIMTLDATINDESGTDDSVVITGLCHTFR